MSRRLALAWLPLAAASVAPRLAPTLAAFAAATVSELASRDARAEPSAGPCEGWLVEYAVSARLQLSDTPLGQGDGVYTVGPGEMVLRFEDVAGSPGGRVKLVSYDMRQAFEVVAKTLLGSTTVATDAMTTTRPDVCSPPEGVLDGAVVTWAQPVAGFRTDGTLNCSGTFCGRFGAPPRGASALHIGPHLANFQPFTFGADMRTFTMPSMFVSRTDMPKQTAHLALAGRESRRTCLASRLCK